MSAYTVADEFAVVRDGAVLHYTRREIGTTVELSDAEAAEPLEAGRLLPVATVTVDGVEVQGEIGARPDGAEPGERIDAEQADESPAEEKPRGRRRGRGDAEG